MRKYLNNIVSNTFRDLHSKFRKKKDPPYVRGNCTNFTVYSRLFTKFPDRTTCDSAVTIAKFVIYVLIICVSAQIVTLMPAFQPLDCRKFISSHDANVLRVPDKLLRLENMFKRVVI